MTASVQQWRRLENTLLQSKTRMETEGPLVFVSTYNIHIERIKRIIRQNWRLLELDEDTKRIFNKSPIFAFRNNANVKNKLVKEEPTKHSETQTSQKRGFLILCSFECINGNMHN